MMGIIECWLLLFGLLCVQEQADGAKENLAQGATATQSTTSGSQSADLAIDGGKDFSTSSKSCASTLWENNQWWRLDLLSPYLVSTVVVTYRQDSFPGYMKVIKVNFGKSLQTLWSSTMCTMISSDKATFTITYTCGQLEGQYIMISSWGTLSVCEVEVYVTEHIRRSFMKLTFNSNADLTDPAVAEQALKELTSALAVRGITNVTLSWSQTPEEEVIQRQVHSDSC